VIPVGLFTKRERRAARSVAKEVYRDTVRLERQAARTGRKYEQQVGGTVEAKDRAFRRIGGTITIRKDALKRLKAISQRYS